MQFYKHSRHWLTLLVVALAALLGVLAFLQFRWLGQVSEAEHQRRQAALFVAAQRFGEDFDRELARAFVTFQLDSETIRLQKWDDYARRFDLWVKQAPHPGMVKGIYLIQAGSKAGVSQYDIAQRRFGAVPDNQTFAALQHELERQGRGVGEPSKLGTFPSINGFPAIVCPLAISPQLVELSFSQSPNWQPRTLTFPPAFTVVLLDQEYIRQNMIPALARPYFTLPNQPDQWEYQLLIANADRSAPTIYASDGATDAHQFPVDLSFPLFNLRPELVDNFSLGGVSYTLAPAVSVSALAPSGSVMMQSGATGVVAEPLDAAKTRVGQSKGVLGLRDERRAVFGYAVGVSAVDTASVGVVGETPRWAFFLRHRSGSLEKAVAATRRNNLIISFGVILLLAASLGLVLTLTARSRRLAAQQLEFIAGVSHELRTPVAAVRLASANLADGVVRGDDQVRQYGAMLQTEGRRLSEMIEQVLDFSGLESASQPYKLVPVPVTEPLEHALATLRQLAGNTPLHLECEVEAGLPHLLADSRAVERALNNLLSNAFKYGGDEVRIRVIARLANAEHVAITVEDSGPGIKAAEFKHLFQPFWRGSAARAMNASGNGLGLCLVARIARAHGGRVEVQSDLGIGSRFTLYLPCAPTVPLGASELYEQTSVAD